MVEEALKEGNLLLINIHTQAGAIVIIPMLKTNPMNGFVFFCVHESLEKWRK